MLCNGTDRNGTKRNVKEKQKKKHTKFKMKKKIAVSMKKKFQDECASISKKTSLTTYQMPFHL